MNSEEYLESFEISQLPFPKGCLGSTWTGCGDDVNDHFRKKSLFFRDTRDHPEHDAKNRLSLPCPSPEKSLAEIDELKNNRPYDPNSCVIIKKF